MKVDTCEEIDACISARVKTIVKIVGNLCWKANGALVLKRVFCESGRCSYTDKAPSR